MADPGDAFWKACAKVALTRAETAEARCTKLEAVAEAAKVVAEGTALAPVGIPRMNSLHRALDALKEQEDG